jgi:hypothetical protein
MCVLHRQILVGFLPILPSVTRTLDEGDARDRRHGLKVVHGKDQRLLHHAMDQKPVLGRIQLRCARVAALIVQVGRRYGSHQLVQWGFRIDGIIRIDVAPSWFLPREFDRSGRISIAR